MVLLYFNFIFFFFSLGVLSDYADPYDSTVLLNNCTGSFELVPYHLISQKQSMCHKVFSLSGHDIVSLGFKNYWYCPEIGARRMPPASGSEQPVSIQAVEFSSCCLAV